MKPLLLPIFLSVLLLSCRSREIINQPLDFNEDRRELSLLYLQERYGLIQDEPFITPKMVVVHWTAIPTLEGSLRAFEDSRLPSSREGIAGAGDLNVSSQYLIDQDGTIYQLLPDTLMARHVIGLNHCAIGIENVGGTPETPLTRKQFRANRWLIRQLHNKYDLDYLIGHYEYTRFENTALWLEKDDGYRTVKSDPGKDFIEGLRRSLNDLDWKPVPEGRDALPKE